MNHELSHTYIVTGATGAIGAAIVRALIAREAREKHSCHLILACRNADKADSLINSLKKEKDAENATIEFIGLDLGRFASVKKFVDTVRERDILITTLFNNAGTMPGEMHLTVDGYESATQVNYIATRMLTHMLLDNIEDGGSIVFTTSLTRRFARLHSDWEERSRQHQNRFITYGRSKKMITSYAMHLARQLKPRDIRVNCSDPWIVDSAMITIGVPWIDRLSDRMFRPLIHRPEQGAATAIKAAFSPETGRIFS